MFAGWPTGRAGRIAAGVLLLMLTASCTSSDEPRPAPTIEGAGGTLRVGLLAEGGISGWCPFRMCGMTMDPLSTSFVDVYELDRCCFMRTLLTYNGASVAEGGTVVRPDMASLPAVSQDGLTWTFHLRRGVHYAPPFDDTEIVAADFIRSFERAFTPASSAVPWAEGGAIGGYMTDSYLAPVIEGVEAFSSGTAPHVSGLEAPDPHTLTIHLVRPVGDLPYRVAIPGLGPIPANPARPNDPLGVAQGHDFDYGDVIVSSGPYMFEGSEDLSYAAAPEDQVPPEGNGFDKATLVRNPSWSPANDPVRTPRPDRIEFYRIASPLDAEDLIEAGALDVALNWAADPETTSRWLDDPELRDRIEVAPADGMRYLSVNLAVQPLDDVHVRRAINLLVDREAVARALEADGTSQEHEVFTHLALDSYEDNLLLSYAPPGVTPTGDLAAARAEMRRSRYDEDGDGRCEGAVCADIRLVAHATIPFMVDAAEEVAAQVRAIGLDLRVDPLRDEEFFSVYGRASERLPLMMGNWFKDYPSASTFFPLLIGGEYIDSTNSSMIGASDAQLERYGYSVRSVPDLDARIAACETLVYRAQTRCWAQLDQYLMEQVVPFVPLTQIVHAWLFSSRVRDFTVDAAAAIPLPAIERLGVTGAPTAPPPVAEAPVSVPPIPEGLYRVEISRTDLLAAGGTEENAGDVGTFTIELRDGWFRWHQRGRQPIFDPIAVGRYEGTADRVTFHVDAPIHSADELSPLRWRTEGDSLSFSLPRCTGPAAKDAPFCAFQTALFTAGPWERVTASP